jgi:glycosyltransferase involved in cell wall biosynthesis
MEEARKASGPSQSWLGVSLIVPVHNGGVAFVRCQESICALKPAPLEVIVVSDGSTDCSAEHARRAGCRVLRTTSQSGPAVARNLGARAAAGNVLFFVDADVILPPDAVGRVKTTLREYPRIDALLGSYDDQPLEPNFLSQYKNLLHHHVHQQASVEAFTFWTGCGAVYRNAFWEVDGFDERYRRPCVEDIELGYRLKAAGYRIRMCKELQVRHCKRWQPLSLLRADLLDRALPWTELILKQGRFEDDLNISRSARLKVALAFLLAGLLASMAWYPIVAWPAAVTAASLFALDRPLWRFFRQQRGWFFALRTVPWQWFSYLYSGLGFAVGLAQHGMTRNQPVLPVLRPHSRISARSRAA